MKIIQFHRWNSMEPPYRKAITVCLFGWCRTIYYGQGIYADYIGKGYHRRMSLGEFKRIVCNEKGGDGMKRVRTYYPKRFWYRKPKRWRPIPMRLSQTGTKGGESFGNTDQKPTEQEGSEAIHHRERKTCHSSGIDLLQPSGTENQEHDPQSHHE
jgi:hypothetical protein